MIAARRLRTATMTETIMPINSALDSPSLPSLEVGDWDEVGEAVPPPAVVTVAVVLVNDGKSSAGRYCK
jgi:hypothetical protein